MSYSGTGQPVCCSSAIPDLKIYQAFIFSVPIFFTFVLLLLFYLFYLRRRRVDWASSRMRAGYQDGDATVNHGQADPGLRKELREMLPVIIFMESFQIRESQCSVCLGDYQANERLQQIPSCGHTFHMDCIDHWLAKNTTCPLCRISLLPPQKSASDQPTDGHQPASDGRELDPEAAEERTAQPRNSERSGEEFRDCSITIRRSSSSSSSEEQQFWDAVRDMEQLGDGQDNYVAIDIDSNVSRV